MKIALGVEYQGRRYLGWQRQDDGLTVQATLETALAGIAGHPAPVVCAGRTDRGVHAVQQVVHFETGAMRPPRAWVLGTNGGLPGDVAVIWAREMAGDFHARFSASQRTYQYIILNRRARPALLDGLVSWECRELDVAKMAEAARPLVGEHDFSSFRAAGCQARSPWRRVQSLTLRRLEEFIVITIRANGFLQHMVRNIAGVLLAIGRGQRDTGWAAEALAARDRRMAGVTAPAAGLYLVNATYPARFAIPEPAPLADRIRLWGAMTKNDQNGAAAHPR